MIGALPLSDKMLTKNLTGQHPNTVPNCNVEIRLYNIPGVGGGSCPVMSMLRNAVLRNLK